MPLLLHRIQHDLQVLKNDGCQLVEPELLFLALMSATNGDPCTTGCTYFNKGTCKAYLKYHSIELDRQQKAKVDYARAHSDQSGLIGGRWAGMTSAQIREAEGGISVGEFQKRKQAGKYKV